MIIEKCPLIIGRDTDIHGNARIYFNDGLVLDVIGTRNEARIWVCPAPQEPPVIELPVPMAPNAMSLTSLVTTKAAALTGVPVAA